MGSTGGYGGPICHSAIRKGVYSCSIDPSCISIANIVEDVTILAIYSTILAIYSTILAIDTPLKPLIYQFTHIEI
jgi:hypothetical protein